MLKITRFISNSKNAKTVSVYFRLTKDGKQASIFPKITIQKKYWNKNQKIIRPSHKTSRALNKELKDAENKISDIYNRFTLIGKNFTVNDVVQEYRNTINSTKKSDEESILELFTEYYNDLKNTDPNRINSHNNYRSTKNRLSDFEEYLGIHITSSKINKSLVEQFVNFLFEMKGLMNSTVEKHVKRLKTFLRNCIDCGIEMDESFNQVRVRTYEVSRFSLNNHEIDLIKIAKNLNKTEKKYRDLFLIQCHLGVRLSDLKQLNENNIDEIEKNVTIQLEKSDRTLKIPIPEYVVPLVKKYFIDKDTRIVDQKYNIVIKNVCKKAGINNKVEVISYRSNNKVIENKYKYELVTTHTARRTFITSMYKTGKFRDIELMSITGHKSFSEFKKYIILDNLEVLEKARSVVNNELYKN